MKARFISTSLALLGLSFSLCLSLNQPSHADDSEKLVFAVDVIRHGDRAPIQDIPSAPHKWPHGLGQLTGEGMHQEYELGKEFHQRYVEKNKLLPEHYDHETMYVRATDIDRTLMSAECALMGLYPYGTGPLTDDAQVPIPNRYQPIPIHTRPREQEDVLLTDSVPNIQETYQTYVYDSAEWKERLAKEKPNFERWGKALGEPITNMQMFSGIGDTLHIREIHKVPMPPGLTKADEEAMMNLGEWVFAESFKPPQVGEKAGISLLRLIVKNCDTASKGDSKVKWILYSAHDSTISSLMSAMKAPAKVRPHYSSDLNIALYKNGEKYTVKATLNGEEIDFPGSTHGTSSLAVFDELPNRKAGK